VGCNQRFSGTEDFGVGHGAKVWAALAGDEDWRLANKWWFRVIN